MLEYFSVIFAVGLLIGTIAGLFGVGGGFFSVPAALGGAYLSRMVGENYLRAVFAFLLVYLAYRFLRSPKVEGGEWEGQIKYRSVPSLACSLPFPPACWE